MRIRPAPHALWRCSHTWTCAPAVRFVPLPDKISSTNPRVIDDAKARQLCSDVRRCTYYETCATYGLNVNRVFTDGVCVDKKQDSFRKDSQICMFQLYLFPFVSKLLRRSWRPKSKLHCWLPADLFPILPVTLEAPRQCLASFQDR